MNFDRYDWLLLVAVIMTSVAIYFIFRDKVAINILLITILALGITTGVIKRLYSRR